MSTQTRGLFVDQNNAALATDLYQLTMAAAYWAGGMNQEASFEFFVRKLPRDRAFLVAAGLLPTLETIEALRFDDDAISFLSAHPAFASVSPRFFDWLAKLRFTGRIEAVPEGTVIFENEPILRVTAPLPEAQLVETVLLSLMNFQTLIASKAARIRLAARDKKLIDFGTRRAHGPEAGLLAARASFIGGFDGTSNVLAGRELDLPISGTAAHSYVLAFDRESDAFQHYAECFPQRPIMLVDTFDPLEGTKAAAALGDKLGGIRLDSGDLAILSRDCRRILDQSGASHAAIVATGDLNEDSIDQLLSAGAPIDIFGVGTELVTSRDDPALGGVYKMVERRTPEGGRVPTMKMSLAKVTYPGPKQVHRCLDAQGKMAYDVVELADAERVEAPLGGSVEPLLETVMIGGHIERSAVSSLSAARERFFKELDRLPARLRALHGFHDYPVEIGPGLEALTAELSEKRSLS
jgi:nicotinate phosphoribosyltransferase